MSKFLLFTLLLAQAACSTGRVIRDRAYEDSLNAYRRSDPAAALEKFPGGETGGLITSIEKSWLNMWSSKWDPSPLQKQVDTFNERDFTSLSREAEYFLFQEAEEGYVPSEHEIVILNLLSATHFIKIKKADEAAVELRRAGYVLDRYWDDPALRLWLGALWAGIGNWNEALVDFRRSQELKPTPELARLIRESEPRSLALHFYGVGPALHWTAGEYTPTFLELPEKPNHFPIHASSLPWFKRHEKRNTALRDTLVKSNFMAQYMGSKTLTETERGIHKTAVWTFKGAAVAFTAALLGGTIYLLSQAGDKAGEALAPLFAGEIGLGIGLWKLAESWDRDLARSLEKNENRKNEDLRIYRMARFLPGWIALESSNREQLALQDSVDHIILGRDGHQVVLTNHY